MQQNLTEIKRQAVRRGHMAYYSIQMQRDAVKLAVEKWKAENPPTDDAQESEEDPPRIALGIFKKPKADAA